MKIKGEVNTAEISNSEMFSTSVLDHALVVLMWAVSECTSSVSTLEDLDLSYQITFSREESTQFWAKTVFSFVEDTFRV